MVEPLTQSPRRRYDRLLHVAVTFGLAAFAVIYAIHAYTLITFPGDVDNIEGFVLYQGYRLANNQGGYPPLDEPPYVVDTYPPFYPLVLALGAKLGFGGLGWARLVSSLSIGGVSLAVFFFVYFRTDRWWPSLVAALLVPATFHIFHWGSLARVDSLGLFLTAVALLLVDREKLLWLAAILFALATYTKPTFLAAPFAAFIYGILREQRRQASLWFFAYLAVTIVLYGIAHLLTGGRFTEQVLISNVNEFRLMDVVINYRWWFWQTPVMSVLALVYLLESRRTGRRDLPSVYLVLAALSALSVGKVGSGPNYFFEMVVACAVCTGLLIAESMEASAKRDSLPIYQTPLFITCMLLMQLLATVHWPGGRGWFAWAWSPSEEEQLEARKLRYVYQEAQSPVLAERPGLALAAGHEPWWQPFICTQLYEQGVWDEQPVIDALLQRKFSYVGLTFDAETALKIKQWDKDQIDENVLRALLAGYGLVINASKIETYVYAPHTPTPTPTPTSTPTPSLTPTPQPTATAAPDPVNEDSIPDTVQSPAAEG